MKVQILSDHHLEFRNRKTSTLFNQLGMKKGQVDLGIIAGDYIPLRTLEQHTRLFRELASYYEQVIYVPGNHDYYGHVPKDVSDGAFRILQERVPNIRVLTPENPIFTYKGQRFIGSTMWYLDSPELRIAWDYIADTGQIPEIEWVFEHCAKFDKILRENLTEDDIVITHHLPTDKATPPMWKDSPTQPFFVHNQERIISEIQPKMWIFGHTHTSCDFQLGKTRIFCNPIGYPSENIHVDTTAARSIIEL